jgi:hypothetical protein
VLRAAWHRCGRASHAQNQCSWVASFGDNGNPCTRAFPCLTFLGALSKTNINGEINCVDAGEFHNGPSAGNLFISKSVTIDCQDFAAISGPDGCVYRKLDSAILVMKST